jgi:hypothetical protein
MRWVMMGACGVPSSNGFLVSVGYGIFVQRPADFFLFLACPD